MSFHGISYGPRIRSGVGSLGALGQEARALAGEGASVLLVADAGLAPFGIIERAVRVLETAGLAPVVYAEIAGEPKEAQVDAARRLGRASGVTAAVCLGGGSALDAGKLAATLMFADAPVADFRLSASPLPTSKPKVICVPTTAGTGSEVTPTSVVSGPAGTKYWFWGHENDTDLALLDPELTVGLPPRFTALTGMDALIHAIEAATNRYAKPESDAAAFAAIRLATEHLPIAVREPGNLEARGKMLDAAALGGLAIRSAGTALAHNIGHALGSLAPVPHGLAVTLAFAATAEWVVEGNRPAFALVAEAMRLGSAADAVPHGFRHLASEIGLELDTSAAAPGLTPETLAAAMAAPENAAMRKSTKRQVSDADLLPLAEMTLSLGRGRTLLPVGEGGRGAAG